MEKKTLVNAPGLAERAYRIRRNALRMGEVQGQGYIAQALDIADILAAAYFHAMRFRPEDPSWEGRDRFLLSNGHYAIALYAALIEAGIIPEAELETYGSDESRLPMSGMASYTPGMEMSGGSLGLGLSIAVGRALGLKRKGSDARIFILFSDGELDTKAKHGAWCLVWQFPPVHSRSAACHRKSEGAPRSRTDRRRGPSAGLPYWDERGCLGHHRLSISQGTSVAKTSLANAT